MRTFDRSRALLDRFHETIPGGAHTYAKGDDQYPEGMAPYILRGKGSHVWDVDENEYIEFGSGLRSVNLGHAYEPVIAEVRRRLDLGANFVRPSLLELECAEALREMIPGAEMVKFGKNGSDATSAAVRLSRCYTGRSLVAICGDHPFFSVDDWFIGTTAMNGGIPQAIQDLTLKFRYNDLDSLKQLFSTHPANIACVILEAEKDQEPNPGFLEGLKALCQKEGAVLVFDEMITGFRWDNGGAQAFFNVIPDLSTFGKGLGNGFSVSALVGRREIMQQGGWHHDRERVFLLSLTHGAETHSLSAAVATMRVYREEPVVKTLWLRGKQLRTGIEECVQRHNLQGYFEVIGRPCSLVYATRDVQKKPSQGYRTLFLQETITRGILAPSLVVSYSHTEEDIKRTITVFDEALEVYSRALRDGLEKFLHGRPVKPAVRKYN